MTGYVRICPTLLWLASLQYQTNSYVSILRRLPYHHHDIRNAIEHVRILARQQSHHLGVPDTMQTTYMAVQVWLLFDPMFL